MVQLKIFVISFLSLFSIMRLCEMSTKNPLSVALFLIITYIFTKLHSDRTQGRIESKDPLLAGILSVLFTAFTIFARYEVILGGLTSRLFCFVVLLFTGTGLVLIYYYLSIWILQAPEMLVLTKAGYSFAWFPYATAGICMLCWLPYFLYEYPGVMTPDSINQYAQAVGIYELNNHHSVVHTAIIRLCCNIGVSITGDVHTGLALYTILQMLFMAFVAGYVVRTLQKAETRFSILIITACFYALMPYNGAFAVTMWKDIPFAGCMTLFAAALMRFLLRGNSAASADDIPKLTVGEFFSLVLPYLFSGIMLCLLRANGWYTFLVCVPFILVVYRKCPKSMITMHLMILVFVFFIKYPVMTVYEIRQADFVESLSVPVQQIARVIYNGEPLTEEQTAFISQIMDLEQVPLQYQPDVSDNIKNLIRRNGNQYLELHRTEFLITWFSIGIQHPKAYLDAWVEQTNGYWYPDISCETGLADGIYNNEFGLSWQPVIRGNIIVKIKEILFKLPDLIPLYGLLWSMGFMFWLVLVTTALGLRSGSAANALICLPFVVLVATLCIAAPVSNEFRYAYSIFYALPVILLSPFVRAR